MRKNLFITLILTLLCVVLLLSCDADTVQTSDITADNASESTSAPTAHEHSFGEWATKKVATCNKYGELVRTCSECGEREIKVTPKSDDHLEVKTDAVAPTCRKAGLTEGTHCYFCNIVIKPQEAVAKLEHTVVIDRVITATCQKTGMTEGSHCGVCDSPLTIPQTIPKIDHKYKNDVCVMCGEKKGSAEQAECPHVYRDWHDVKKATCTQNGEQMRECRKCGYQETKVTNKLVHVYDGGVCINCGNKNGSAGLTDCSHVYREWYDVIKATCEDYGAQMRECRKCGYQETKPTEKLGHDYNNNVCVNCGKTSTAVDCQHNFENWTVLQKADCFFTGTETRTCKKCGEVETKTTPKNDDHLGRSTRSTIPTCTDEGRTESIVCVRCDKVLKEAQPIPRIDHEYYDSICVMCGKLDPNYDVENCNHTFSVWYEKTIPTCKEYGEHIRECRKCGKVETRTVEKENHVYRDSFCIGCGRMYTGPVVVDCQHSFGNWKVLKKATCAEKGEERRTCSKCGEVERKITSKTDHLECIYPAIPATCQNTGVEESIVCGICSKTIKLGDHIPKTDHQYQNGACVTCGKREPSA